MFLLLVGLSQEFATAEEPVEWRIIPTASAGISSLCVVYGISGDGEVAVGGSIPSGGAPGQTAWRWRRSSWQNLGILRLPLPDGQLYAGATAVDFDGRHIAGWLGHYGPFTSFSACLWIDEASPISLSNPQFSNQCRPNSCSADGATVVGVTGYYENASSPFKWTAGGGIVNLAAPTFQRSTAFAASADGTLFAGAVKPYESDWLAAIWGLGDALTLLTDANYQLKSATGFSADGLGVIGETASGQAYLWTEADGALLLGSMPGFPYSRPSDISADRTVIVGKMSATHDFSESRSFLWHRRFGMLDLRDYLEHAGVRFWGNNPVDAVGISDDGQHVVGQAHGSSSWSDPFYARLKYRCAVSDLDFDLQTGLSDLAIFLTHYGFCEFNGTFYLRRADMDLDGCINLTDLAILLAEFGTVCPE
ncbi:MAG: hypothetical protein ACKVS9_18320 [Phycisphaerae bacterium]